MTVLVWGVPSEPPVERVAVELKAIGGDVVVVHPRAAPRQSITIEIGGTANAPVLEGALQVEGRHIPLADVIGAYVRPVEPALVPELAVCPPDHPTLAHPPRLSHAHRGFPREAG